jgi:hypothetical protein
MLYHGPFAPFPQAARRRKDGFYRVQGLFHVDAVNRHTLYLASV